MKFKTDHHLPNKTIKRGKQFCRKCDFLDIKNKECTLDNTKLRLQEVTVDGIVKFIPNTYCNERMPYRLLHALVVK